jgi:hypothetical protein
VTTPVHACLLVAPDLLEALQRSTRPSPFWEIEHNGVLTLIAVKRIKTDLAAGQAQAAILAIALYSAIALKRCRRVADPYP